ENPSAQHRQCQQLQCCGGGGSRLWVCGRPDEMIIMVPSGHKISRLPTSWGKTSPVTRGVSFPTILNWVSLCILRSDWLMGVTQNYTSGHGQFDSRCIRFKLCLSPLSPAAPRISIPQRSGMIFRASSFPCHVWGFYPRDIAVTWLRDGRVRAESTYSSPQRNPDGTFHLTLTYTFTPMDWDRGSILTCRVSHSALAQPLQAHWPVAGTPGVGPRTGARSRGEGGSGPPQPPPGSGWRC
uniref:Ig-like domain-containing protein n=1 Tax=Chelydra serpentina TaxID=8475 RepID=A0A8C3T7K2_CHESE